MIVDLKDFSPTAVYHLMTQSVIPRPIAWVLSQNTDNSSYNLAPFSYFTAVSSSPALLLFSCAPKPDGSLKDTVINCERQKRFVIHIANASQLQAVQDSATPLDYGESELALTDLSLTDFGSTGLKRIREAPIAFACKLHQSLPLGNAPQTLIVAEVEHLYINDDSVAAKGKRITINADKINPLARLGGGQFADIDNIRKPKMP